MWVPQLSALVPSSFPTVTFQKFSYGAQVCQNPLLNKSLLLLVHSSQLTTILALSRILVKMRISSKDFTLIYKPLVFVAGLHLMISALAHGYGKGLMKLFAS